MAKMAPVPLRAIVLAVVLNAFWASVGVGRDARWRAIAPDAVVRVRVRVKTRIGFFIPVGGGLNMVTPICTRSSILCPDVFKCVHETF